MKPKRPKFKPKSGQMDYSKARWCPVVNCVLRYKGKILLVQRSKELPFYPGFWNGISGFLDDQKSLREKVEEELREELGIGIKQIKKFILGEIFNLDAPKYKKTWIVHPILVDVTTNKIKLDWEAKKFAWVAFAEARTMKLLPGFEAVLNKVKKLIKNNFVHKIHGR